MDLFQLTKEEIPLMGSPGFVMPIHPKLLEDGRIFDPRIAYRVFAQAADEWYTDLERYLEEDQNDLEPETKEFYEREYLRPGRPTIQTAYDEQCLSTIPFWNDRVLTDERGFATSLSISRNGGGSLYFNTTDRQCQTGICLNTQTISFTNIQGKKALELIIPGTEYEEYADAYKYGLHNVDHHPGALFLRNWALLYLNETMKQLN